MSPLRRYGAVLGAPDAARLVAASFLARQGVGLYSLAILLLVRGETGSYATAGAVAAGFAVGLGAGQPAVARLLDRRGRLRVLPALVVVHLGAILALVALTPAGAPAVVLVVAGVLIGVGQPPIGATMRALWPRLLQGRRDLLPTAFALDGVLSETAFVIGPLFVGVAVAVSTPGAALVVGGICVAVGVAWMLAVPLVREPPPTRPGGPRRLLGALASPGLRTLLACTAPLGFTFGAVEVVLPAFCDARGHDELSGPLLAVWAGASAVGGLAYGAVAWNVRLGTRFVAFTATLPAAYALVALPGPVGLMFAVAAVAGVVIAPTLTAVNELTGEAVAAGSVTEGYAWVNTALILGIAVGNATAGALVEAADWRVAALVGAAATVVALTVAVARRPTLEPAVAV